MPKYQVEKTTFKVCPEDSYFLDLIWIEEAQGPRGPYLRWHWLMSKIDSQKEWEGCRATSQTPLTPTINNRFGAFLQALQGAELQVGTLGSTEQLCMEKYRVKGFIEHNKKTYDGEEVTFCNVTKLIEGSAKAGIGIGPEGAHEKLKALVNEYFKTIGQPALKEEASAGEKSGPGPVHKQKDISW